jgi:hypothetical protein
MHDFKLPPELPNASNVNTSLPISIRKNNLIVEIKPLSLGRFQINNH